MDRLGLLIGMAAGEFHIYNEIQKNQQEDTEEDETGQNDITG